MSWRRLLVLGALTAAAVGLAGGLLEWRWFGPSAAAAAARADRYVQARFDVMVASLETVAERIASDETAPASISKGEDGARALFDLAAAARAAGGSPDEIAVTVYDENFDARAWAGRASEIPRERIGGPTTLFVTRSPLGLRLVHVQPIAGADGRRVGSIAAEHVVAPAPAAQAFAGGDFTLPTPVAPATLRLRHEVANETPREGARQLRAPSGELLLEAFVSPDALSEARTAWRRRVAAIAIVIAGITLLLLIGPLLDRRAAARDERTYVRATIGAMAIAGAGGLLIWLAFVVSAGGLPPTAATLLLSGFIAAAIVALLAGPAARLRLALRRRRTPASFSEVRFVAQQLAAGAAVAGLLVVFQRLLYLAVNPVSVDLRHLSLHPWGDGTRVMLLAGILVIHLAAIWAGTLTLNAASAPWTLPRRHLSRRLLLPALWMSPVVVIALLAAARGWPFSWLGITLATLACGLAALSGPQIVSWYRRTTVASRILALFMAFLVPSLLLYPSLDFFAERATRRLITEQYAVQAQTHPQTLQSLMTQAQREIDALPILPGLVTAAVGPQTPDSAFLVWRQTALARERLTSAVELYNRDGVLISRFALNVPEYTVAAQTASAGAGCDWDLFGEAAPIGSEERRMLHAERRICIEDEDGGPRAHAGTIVLHVVFDYRTLPFITSQSPYFELFRPTVGGAPGEATAGGKVEIAIYGWGLQPIYTSGPSAWAIDDALFARLYASRDPFWTVIPAGGVRHRVYFSNAREGIFALGYPVLSVFDHFVHLAELTTLAGAGFLIVLVGTAVFTRLGREQPRVGRALLREIRASFYRKLFLAFVLAAIIPVLTLAVGIRFYFRNLLLTDVEAEAARTAAVARRVIEESDVLSRRGESVDGLSDDIMVWIRQVIDQDVNIFIGASLDATSERDLFASGLLPTRTPDDVYRAIVLQRLSSYVSADRIGTVPYLVAAAPVRTAGHDALLTVPLAPRQREIEQEIDDLDRGVHLASLFFILLGAAIGLSMAERIADPVRRLTRATRQIARGDFDARIAVRSADELKRLVDAFNSMAAELKAQRVQLERTHRLEAWAEMARQVAHEIKNPLTPIQLSAEHLQRVHADRGEPMGPVLESCVSSILSQVHLLRQISAEFSNFASSPTAKPAAVDVADLVAEVLEPYRTGLAGRIDVNNRVPAGLPRAFVDRTLIARALANIVENALFAMPSTGTLTLDGRAEDEFVVLSTADSGIGMDQDALDRVFEPYFSTKTTGTGLGLPIARRNVELSGGTIEVASEKGRGTVVTIRLPVSGT